MGCYLMSLPTLSKRVTAHNNLLVLQWLRPHYATIISSIFRKIKLFTNKVKRDSLAPQLISHWGHASAESVGVFKLWS
jgi:hypothetical protein